jgi:hypothetical protein
MRKFKTRTYFEQVPIALALRVAEQEALLSRTRSVSCAICGTPVGLEHCKTDEAGGAVHGHCYVTKLASTAPTKVRTESGA